MTDTASPGRAEAPPVYSHRSTGPGCKSFDDYIEQSPEEKALGLFSILSEDGEASAEDTAFISRDLARDLYRGMLQIRVVDARLMILQRQGRIGFYGEALGQEAAVIGCAAALEKDDWYVPALREAGGGLYRGMSLSSYVAQIMGTDEDLCKGRQMPCHPCDPENNYVVMSSCVSSQIPHAVGIAMAMKVSGADEVCMGFMGDGGTSEGDFHVALNFAGVSNAPAVLVCQNNQWAISTPGIRQTAAPTIAVKGVGYGVESLRVDGNDVFACYRAAKYAVNKARRGGGPTFLELLTYRVGAHSSSDDPSQYRDEDHTKLWKESRDPLLRIETFLSRTGFMDEGERTALRDAIFERINEAIAGQEKAGTPKLDTLIEDVFAKPHWRLLEQLADYRAVCLDGNKEEKSNGH